MDEEKLEIGGEEERKAFLRIANCSYNFLNINLCKYITDESADALPDDNFAEIIVCSIFYMLTMIVGVASNLFVLVTVIIQHTRSSASAAPLKRAKSRVVDRKVVMWHLQPVQLIINDTLILLCTTDLVVICISIPIRLVRWFTYTWVFGLFLCKVVFYVQYWSAVCSILTTVFLALQRYYATAHPLAVRSAWTLGRVRVYLCLICVVSAVLTLPLLIAQTHRPIGASSAYYWCITEFDSDTQLIVFEAYMFGLLVAVPIATMTTLYTCMLRKIPGASSRARSKAKSKAEAAAADAEVPDGMEVELAVEGRTVTEAEPSTLHATSTCGGSHIAAVTASVASGACNGVGTCAGACSSRATRFQRNQLRYRRTMRLLVLSVLVFIVCWTPYQTDRLLSAIGVVRSFNVGWVRRLRMATTLLAHANSSLNPLIYCFLSPAFRKYAWPIAKRFG